MATTITLELGGCANGAPVDLTGRAVLDGSSLELDLESRAVPLHWDPLLGLLGLLDAALVLALVEAGGLGPFESASLRRRAEFFDEHGRELGHEVLSMVLRGASCRAQYLAANTRIEAVERATSVEASAPFIALPAGKGSLLLTSAPCFESNWGNGYRVAALTNATVHAECELAGPVEVRLLDTSLVRGGDDGGLERMRFGSVFGIRRLLPSGTPGPR